MAASTLDVMFGSSFHQDFFFQEIAHWCILCSRWVLAIWGKILMRIDLAG